MGSVVFPFVGENDEYYLAPGKTGDFHLTEDELLEYFAMDEMPILFEGELKWSNDF
jgi:hypothetical protein